MQPTALANGFGSDQTDMTTGATEQTDTENAPTDQNTTDDKTSDNNSAPADMPDKTKNGEQPTGPATNENGQNTYPTGNSLLSSTACSILDYIQQRIAEIQSQLSAS
ncbi:hypothetical protein SDC9_144638 [bioreactor metagenome]|uniref:Uncharacterized protein n=1 Tax=bioreactor metagenome TaxID=1076179 RepID=A0A645E7K2_9ZZZZ